jgi:hypothetical protein
MTMKDEASYIYDSCGEEIVVPIDLSAEGLNRSTSRIVCVTKRDYGMRERLAGGKPVPPEPVQAGFELLGRSCLRCYQTVK